MPVESDHPHYERWSEKWQRVRDVMDGEDAVKGAGPKYLPMLSGQNTDEYDGYKKRAMFYEASRRTVLGLLGAVFRKEPVIEAPQGAEPFIEQAAANGSPLAIFAKDVTDDVLAMGRVGVLVDVGPVEGDTAYLTWYAAEHIRNWRSDGTSPESPLSLVVLAETRVELGDDAFEQVEVELRRVLTLRNGVYVQQVWAKRVDARTKKEEWILEDEIMPVRAGKNLDFIPFTFIGVTNLDAAIEPPPLLGLVNVNLSHYRTSADLEHGAHYTALPTPWVSGDTGDESPDLKIGPAQAWILPENGAAGMLEYTGQGLSALEKRLESKEKLMAVLGARLLEDQKAGVEAADTVRLRHSGENSLLASIAGTVSRGLSRAASWAVWWDGGEPDSARVDLNRDFFDVAMTPDQMRALVEAWQKKAFPIDVLWRNLRDGEIIPPDLTDEDLREMIDQEGPSMLDLFSAAQAAAQRPPAGDEDDEEEGEGAAAGAE